MNPSFFYFELLSKQNLYLLLVLESLYIVGVSDKNVGQFTNLDNRTVFLFQLFRAQLFERIKVSVVLIEIELNKVLVQMRLDSNCNKLTA